MGLEDIAILGVEAGFTKKIIDNVSGYPKRRSSTKKKVRHSYKRIPQRNVSHKKIKRR